MYVHPSLLANAAALPEKWLQRSCTVERTVEREENGC